MKNDTVSCLRWEISSATLSGSRGKHMDGPNIMQTEHEFDGAGGIFYALTTHHLYPAYRTMPPSASRSQEDCDFLDNMSMRSIAEFRDTMFKNAFIEANPRIFLDTEWIDVTLLRTFLRDKGKSAVDPLSVSSSPPPITLEFSSASRLAVSVKRENTPPIPQNHVKCESDPPTSILSIPSIKTRTLRDNDNNRDVIELLSDSDTEEAPSAKQPKREDCDEPSRPTLVVKSPHITGNVEVLEIDSDSDSEDDDEKLPKIDFAAFRTISTTIWDDPHITSKVIEKRMAVTKSKNAVVVERVELLTDLPSLWPVLPTPTAFLLLLDDPKFDLVDQYGILATVDGLHKKADGDSWQGTTGSADSPAWVTYQPGTKPIKSRRSRLTCQGIHACQQIDRRLLQHPRFELDPSSRDAVLTAQRKTRGEEGNSAEKIAVVFHNVVTSKKCTAVDAGGNPCAGHPMMKAKAKGSVSRNHGYWIACDGWRRDFKENHRTEPIPDNVDEDILAKLFRGASLVKDEEIDLDTAPCSRIIPPHIGGRQKKCPHPHIINGKAGMGSPIIPIKCKATRTVYVPHDDRLRFALIVHPNTIPHSHPMPIKSKVSYGTKLMYRKCVQAAGSSGNTALKVDSAPSTKLLLGGRTPAQFAPALQNKRIKRDIVRDEKLKKYPDGLDLKGLLALFLRTDFLKPPSERYIQDIIFTPTGGVLVLTFVPYLLSLIHQVPSFECDVTFKRVTELNEWEMVIFYAPVQRTITVGRIYTNRADTDHFERLFDELQRCVLLLTGKPMRFRRFSEGGNLLVMNADMEAAQILGAGRSFLRVANDPQHSQITTTKAEDFVQYFARVCLTHSKRGVLDFRSLVSKEDYERIINFPYLNSTEELDDFTVFIKDLGVKKIQDWWSHKYNSAWIVPCIVKSQSKIAATDWITTPATTNTGEGQHHWTNTHTGIRQTLVEGLQSARDLDEQVKQEVMAAIATGVDTNPNNELYHRMSRTSQRQSQTIKKSRELEQTTAASADLRSRIEKEKALRKESSERSRALQEELSASSTSKKRAPAEATSSSGRVRSTPPKKVAMTSAVSASLMRPILGDSDYGGVNNVTADITMLVGPSALAEADAEAADAEAFFTDINIFCSGVEASEPVPEALYDDPQHNIVDTDVFNNMSNHFTPDFTFSFTDFSNNDVVPDGSHGYGGLPNSFDYSFGGGSSALELGGYSSSQWFDSLGSDYQLPLEYDTLPPLPVGWDSHGAGASSTAPSSPTLPLLPTFPSSSPFLESDSPLPSSSFVNEVLYGKGKKRARDEVDEAYIMPSGSRRVRTKTARAVEAEAAQYSDV